VTRVIEIDWPEFGGPAQPPGWRETAAEYSRRIETARAWMRARGLTHFAVYGDREHFANLAWLIGFDPRFEEALLLIARDGDPLLLAGNECLGYIPASPMAVNLRLQLFPHFSLPSQPVRPHSTLLDTFRQEGIDAHSRIGLAGWKPYPDPQWLDAPSYIADQLRFAAGFENVMNAASFFVDPATGVRTTITAREALFFEWTNTLATEGMKRVIRAVKPGAMDYELLEQARYNGVPLGCHMTLKCGANRVSLASACGERIERGGRFSCGISYWGANCCRCGWVLEDWPEYIQEFAGPYMEAMAAWFYHLRPGTPGAALHDAVHSRLAGDRFNVFLNAGHLIGLDEWVSSLVFKDSTIPLRSGMVMQADVIPSNPVYYSTRMEDGYLLADARLAAEIEALDPSFVDRAARRRDFMRSVLGLPVHSSICPLGNIPGLIAPFILAPNRVLTLA
jgi:Xaa-Pro aminopeptidase